MKTQLLNELDGLIATLEVPLSSEELANGWTAQSQAAILSLLQNIRDSVRQDDVLPELSIGRGLDHWGIEGGPVFETACTVSNRLREFRGA